jgi:transcriptional regulator with XRE-family HTH domain
MMKMKVEKGGATIQEAMAHRGWTYYKLAKEAGVWPSQVKNILEIEAAGDRHRMGRVQTSSLLRIIEVLWPHVQLMDVLTTEDCCFLVVPKNEHVRRILEGHVPA